MTISKNTCYYDWVRVYDLVDADAPIKTYQDGDVPLYTEKITIGKETKASLSEGVVSFPMVYMANKDRAASIRLSNSAGKVVAEKRFKVLAGYAHMVYDLKFKKGLPAGNYTINVDMSQATGAAVIASDTVKNITIK